VDDAFMDRALFWAERGRGRTSPNPIVGAVIVSPDGVVVGQGAHLQAGGPHAEVHALNAAGADAIGATLYCTLEPCCHAGRTGPCVERIAAAGVSRVVAAVQDPNPLVAGKGFAYLRERGIRVDVGLGADRAQRQNEAFFTWVRRQRPFTVLKAAVSADGFVGRPDRRVKLTGPAADRWLQRQRAEVDALAVGAGTVLVDDPLLTARGVYRGRPLARVLFDWRARVPATARVFSTLDAGPVIMIVADDVAGRRRAHLDSLARLGVTIQPQPARELAPVMAWLAARGITSLLVEGGPALHAAFAEAGLVDRVQRVTTPRMLGDGVRAAAIILDSAGPGRTIHFGEDVLSEVDVLRAD
jgi:diaminohydroxyphosphoribosylaminopyrimidine deaminase/5-amino-6-(5-phosphoribosylamino)uracil reductase